MVDRLLKTLTSLRLTVVCLALSLVLVFVGTIAQVEEGLYQAQARYFKSFLILWSPEGSSWRFPVFPGGYLVGLVLLVNLLAAHAKRFKLTKKKIGIFLIHGGLILLLVGQLSTDLLSTESAMRLREGESKNYSEDFHANELVVIDKSVDSEDRVVSIPERIVAEQKEIRHASLPFTLNIRDYWPNSDLTTNSSAVMAIPAKATRGVGQGAYVVPMKPVVSMENRNMPSAVVEVVGANGSEGSWLVSTGFGARQPFHYQGREYEISMRFKRHYKPHWIELLDFRHDKYKGTEIPKNFSSRVRLRRPDTGEDREVLIYMNSPLRYDGETYYQAGFDERIPDLTILQVVRNPGWLTPYFACSLVGLGLVVQFLTHLIGFATKRRAS